MKTVRLLIAGKVQGVGYRAWATRVAVSLGLRGWLRNRTDGTVELLATGEEDAVAAMAEACRRGPFDARVDSINIFEAEDAGYSKPRMPATLALRCGRRLRALQDGHYAASPEDR
jgi:acylphosphatase